MAPKPAPRKPLQDESSFELSGDVSYGSIDYTDVVVVPPRTAQAVSQRPQNTAASNPSRPGLVRTAQPMMRQSTAPNKYQSSAPRGSSPAAQSYSLTGSIEFSDLSSGTPSGSIDLGDSGGKSQLAGRSSHPQHAAHLSSAHTSTSRQHSTPASAAHASLAQVQPRPAPPIRKVGEMHAMML